MAHTDWELLALYLADDPKAFGELVKRWSPRLRPHLSRILRQLDSDDRHDTIEDVLQEVWLRVAKHAKNGDPVRKFSTWLFTIATNVAFNDSRRRKRAPVRLPLVRDPDLGVVLEFDPPDAKLPPDAAYENHDLLVQLKEFLEDNTSHDNAVALDMFIFRGFSYEEIAALLKIQIGTVKSRVHRGREVARRFLKAQSK